MKALTDDDLRVNVQAKDIAASVLGETVVAATRCEAITQDATIQAAGMGKGMRGMAKFSRGMSKAMGANLITGGAMKMGDEMRSGGLPNSWICAVTETKIHALEDKQHGCQLVAGKILKSWNRDEIKASAGVAMMVPGDDRQQLTLYLPSESNNKYMKAAAAQMAKVGSPGMPTRFLVAKDDASQEVIDELCKNSAAPGSNIMIGGQSVASMMGAAGAGAATPDPTEQLTKLADLHQRGVLSDEEFAAQKAKVLGS